MVVSLLFSYLFANRVRALQNYVSTVLVKVKIFFFFLTRKFSCWQEGVEKEALVGGIDWKVTGRAKCSEFCMSTKMKVCSIFQNV